MKHRIAATLVLGLSFAPAAFAQEAYVLSSVGGNPWGSTENNAAMDLAFGVGGWDLLYFETVNAGTLFSGSYSTVWLEGSDLNASELNTFFTANQGAIESWVSGGGTLFVNAAPNEGASQNWGFGGVVLNYPGTSVDPGTASDPTHPIYNGPFVPVATSYTGTAYAHGHITGGGTTPLLTDASGFVNISELSWGGGVVVFAGLTTSNWWTPTTEALNLRANILDYLANGANGDTDGDGIDNVFDNCPGVANPTQTDVDADGVGDACDACPADPDNDIDLDGVCGDVDVCPDIADPNQDDADSDGNGDVCDLCPLDPDDDIDGDGVCGDIDNCPNLSNPGQVDANGDGVGDACEGMTTPTGTATGGTGSGTGGTGSGTGGGGTATGNPGGTATGGTGTGTGAALPEEYAKLGCGCASAGPAAPGSVAGLLLLGLLGLRRRE